MILYYLFIIFPLVYTCLSVLNKGFYVPIVHRICNDIVLPIHNFPVVYTCLSVLNKGFYVPIVHRICNDIVLPIHNFPRGLYMFIRVEQGILCTYCS